MPVTETLSLDGLGWRAAILYYFRADPLFTAQVARVAGWQAPTWNTHIDIVCEAIRELQNRAV